MVNSIPVQKPPAVQPKRESRHIQIQGLLPQAVPNVRLHSYFSQYGRVQKIDWQYDVHSKPFLVISFRDRPSAMNAVAAKDLKIDEKPLTVNFYEAKNAHAAQHLSNTVQPSQPSIFIPTSTGHSNPPESLGSTNSSLDASSVTAHSGTQRRDSQGASVNRLQGLAVSQLPSKVAELALKQQLTDILTASRAKCKLINISFEQAGDAPRALLLLQDVSDMDLLLAELNQHSLPSLPAHQRLKARQLNQGAVTEAYNAFLASRSTNNPSLSRADSTSSSTSISAKLPDPRQKDACRTLYVGNLDKTYKEDWLRAKFSEFGHVLEVDIKNRDSFSPFAFIQFTNIESVVKAIIANQTNKQAAVGQRNERDKLKLNFGKTILPSNRVWIGALPPSCSQEYLFFRLRNISPDGVQEVDYDSTNHEALVSFKNVEQAQIVYNKIKNRQFVVPPEKPQKDTQSYIQHVDFASEKLYDFFSDRKHGRYKTSSLIASGTESPSSKKSDPATLAKKRPSSREHFIDTSNESLLAPPPDPPQNLQPAVDEASPSMSSRHNRRSSSSRRSSPDQVRHRRDWDRERYERRSDSRSYSSKSYREKRHEKKKRSEPRHESKHHHRSQSSSSSASSSSASSRSSITSSASSVSHNSAKSASKMQQPKSKPSSSLSPITPIIQSPAILPGISGHTLFNQPPPIPPTKNSSTSLKRSDAVDSTFPPSTSSLEVESPDRTKPTTSQTTIQQKQSIQPPKSAPACSSSKPDFRTSTSNGTQLIHRYRNLFSRGNTLNLQTDPERHSVDPRVNNENYRTYTNTDLEPPVYYPSFFLDDEFGRQYCHRMQTLPVQRRNSQSSSSSIPAWQKSDHPPISRSNSGSDHSKTPVSGVLDIPLGIPGFDMPLVPPYPPPPLGTPLESPGPVETRQRSDSTAEANSFSERLQSINSKVNAIRSSTQTPFSAPPQQKSTTIEEDLQRFKMKLSSVTKSSDSSQSTTPTSTASKPVTTPSSRLTINIPASTSNSSTPNIGSPALHSHQPTPSPATSIPNNGGRSMSFSQQNNPATAETPPVTSSGLGPRSSSYNFANSATNSLPLPPQPPPNLPMTSPKAEKVLSPKTSTINKAIVSPALTPTTQNKSMDTPKSDSTPTLTIKQTGISKSAVTSPLTTPSTPRSASSLNESKTPVPQHRDSVDLTEEAKRKKQNEKIKLFQSIKVPKKPRDTAEEIFSFSSPLSRAPHPLPQSAQHPATTAPKPLVSQPKPTEKPSAKPQLSNVPPVNRTPTQSSLVKPEKKDKKLSMEEKDKLKPSKSSTMLLTKTDSKGQKTSVLATLSEKDRRNSEALIESEMKRIQEKAARKFPNEEKEREKYVRKKQEKLRQRAEEVVLRQKEKQKEAAKKPDDAQKKLPKKSLEHKLSSQQSKPIVKEQSKEKELKAAKKEFKEKSKEMSKESSKDGAKQKLSTVRKKRQRTPSDESESGSDDESEEDNSSEILAECGLRKNDLELQRILFEEAKSGQLNLSLYDRVRRRRQATQPDENKKSQALEMLRESKKKEKKPKRVQLSSDDDSDAAGSHKQSKPSASENSDSDHSEASTAASSSSALKAKKLSRGEYKKKDKLEKRKKSDKPQVSKKLSLKKMIKKEPNSTDEDSCDDFAVKKLKKNLSSYNNESEESEHETVVAAGRGRPKKNAVKKLKPKKSTSTLLADDDFGESDEERLEPKREIKVLTGKPGRPRKIKITGDEDEEVRKELARKQSKKSKQQDELDEPIKKKPKILTGLMIKTEPLVEQEKKRRASSEIENVPTIKRPKPEQLPATTMAKMSPTIEQFSPTQSASDSVRLENFVTQSCEPKEHTPLISPLTSGRFGPTSAERAESLLQRKRTPSSSSSTASSSGSSTCSTTSAATSTTKKTLSRQHSDTSSKTAETTAKLRTFQFVKAVDENAAKTSSVEPEQAVQNKEPAKEPSPLRLLDELQFEEATDQSPSVGNQEESDEDCEAMLVQQLNQKEASAKMEEKVIEPMVVERSQETEDAVESLSAFMNANQPKSEDEEDEAFTLITRGDRLSHSSTQSAHILSPKIDQPAAQPDTFAPTVLPIKAPVQSKEGSPQQHVCPPDPAPTVSKAESPVEKVAPITSAVQTVAQSVAPFDTVATTSAPVSEQKQPIVATVASAIPSHLPTPPPSRSSGGSPVTQYPVRQQSPLVASKSAQPVPASQPITEITPKRLSDGAIQPTVQQPQDFSSPVTQQSRTVEAPIIGGMKLPPHLAQLQQQMLAQRSGVMDEHAAFANKQHFMHMAQPPTTATNLQASFAQPIPTQQRSRAGSQSTVGTPVPIQQRKVAAVTTASVPLGTQQFVAGRNIATTANQPSNTSHTQSPITTNPQNIVSPTNPQLEALLGPLSQMLSMNPAINNSVVMQQLLNSPQFLSQLPQLAANPQALDMVLRQYQLPQISQQQMDVDKFLKSAMQMVGPNASPEAINQAMFTLMHQEQRRQQELELAEKQKQLMYTQYENAMRGNPMLAENLVRQQRINQQPVEAVKHSNSFDENRYPICWQGNLMLKSNGTCVQMHRVSGNQMLMDITTNELASLGQDGFSTLRINQRMKLQNSQMQAVCNKMNDQNEFVALVCFPCGQSAEQVCQQTINMTTNFIEYFTAKMAAGVVTRGGTHSPHPACVAHVFPPCEFSAQQMRRLAPDLFDKIEKVRSTYLFIVVTRNDANGIPHEPEKVHHIMPTMIAQHAIGKTL